MSGRCFLVSATSPCIGSGRRAATRPYGRRLPRNPSPRPNSHRRFRHSLWSKTMTSLATSRPFERRCRSRWRLEPAADRIAGPRVRACCRRSCRPGYVRKARKFTAFREIVPSKPQTTGSERGRERPRFWAGQAFGPPPNPRATVPIGTCRWVAPALSLEIPRNEKKEGNQP